MTQPTSAPNLYMPVGRFAGGPYLVTTTVRIGTFATTRPRH